MLLLQPGQSGMQVQGNPERGNTRASYQSHSHASPWREAADLIRFSLEAAVVSGAIVMLAWFFSSNG